MPEYDTRRRRPRHKASTSSWCTGRGTARQDQTKHCLAMRRVDFDAASMSAGDRLGDKQPEAEPTAATRVVTAGAERLKYLRQDVARDGAVIMDVQSHLFTFPRKANANRRAGRAVLNSVRDEVRDRLDDTMFVPHADNV